MAEISGREVDFRKIQDIAAESEGYAKNYVKVDTSNLTERDKENMANGNGAYMLTKEEAKKRAQHAAKLALAYKKIAEDAEKREDDVKDDEGAHSDGEFMRIDKHGDEYIVHIDKEPEQKFDSLHEALDYVMTMHGDDRFEKDVTDKAEEDKDEEEVKKEEEAKRAAKFRAMYEAKKRLAGRKAAAINTRKASLAPRIASIADADPCSKGLYR